MNPESFQQLDKVIHEKSRMAIMSMLAASPELSFTELRDALNMTDGNVTTPTGFKDAFKQMADNVRSNLLGLGSDRKGADPSSSYTAKLYASGIKRIAQKVGEEGVETALAATVQDHNELKNEAADLLYHLMVLLQASDMSMADVVAVLRARHQ